jgi:hypothetical protein
MKPTINSKTHELRHHEHALADSALLLQDSFGTGIKVSLIVEGLKESTLLTISESVDEPVFIAGESWTLCVPVGRDELILHNGGLPF